MNTKANEIGIVKFLETTVLRINGISTIRIADINKKNVNTLMDSKTDNISWFAMIY